MISRETIEQIMFTARIEEVVEDFVRLKKSGSNYKGLSPFVDEKTPSFMVSPAKQIFKDFSSGKGGNVVTFLMEIEHFSYPEALKWLADRYNITIKEDREQSFEEKQKQSERESLSIVNDFAKDYFFKNIFFSEEGRAIGLSYFKERNFTDEIIKKFQLGYCFDKSNDFTNKAISKGFKQERLIKLGLTKEKEGRKFDFFRGRVMFPIHSISGKVLGFGGRTLRSDKKIAKYFNSPESIIYNKSKVLYGLYFAKNEIIKRDNCYLVEGYTDVISLHQSKVENVVASSGTALTKDQIKLIKRYTKNITILYDGDNAGIKASFRGIDLILEEGLNVKVVLFPDGDDPDSYAKKVNSDELKKYIAGASKDFISFKSSVLLAENKKDPIYKAKVVREIIQSIAFIPDQIIRSENIKQCSVIFEIDEKTLAYEVDKIILSGINKKHIVKEIQKTEPLIVEKNNELKKNSLEFQEYNLIRILIKYGQLAIEIKQKNEQKEEIIETSVSELIVHELEKDSLYPLNETHLKIYNIIKEGIDKNTLFGETHYLKHIDQSVVVFATHITTPKYEISKNWKEKWKINTTEESDNILKTVIDSIYSFKGYKAIDERNNIENKIKNVDDKSDLTNLIKRKIELDFIINKFKTKIGRVIIK